MRNLGAIIAVLVLIGLAVLLVVNPRGEDQQFDRSPLGVRGLELWLKAKGVDIIRSNPRFAPDVSDISIRILPVPESRSDGRPEAQLSPWLIVKKIGESPTLLVLPKWKDSTILEGVAGEAQLVTIADIQNLLDAIHLGDIAIRRGGARFDEADLTVTQGKTNKIALYRAQVFDRSTLPGYCTELAGLAAGALLARCGDDDYHYWLLSDPDLINNHGLALAENSAFAVAMVQALRDEDTRPVYLDSDVTWLRNQQIPDEGRNYERSASDLARLLAYPLSLIWAATLLLTAVAFWRGAYRFGPPLRRHTGTSDVSKTAAIEAVARLLRLSGNDGRMVAQFAHDLLADKAVQIFGPSAGNATGIARLFERLSRRDAEHAAALQSVSTSLMEQGSAMRRADLHRNLHIFKELLGSTDLGSR